MIRMLSTAMHNLKLFEIIQVNGGVHQWLRSQKDAVFNPAARLCMRAHIHPNVVTTLGFVLGLFSLPLLFVDYWWFVLVLVFSTIADGIDGSLARLGQTDSLIGAHYDYVVDLVLSILIACNLVIWLQQPFWILGVNLFGLLLIGNWLTKSPLNIAPNRMTLVISCMLGWPQLGLALLSTYSVAMSLYLIKKLLSAYYLKNVRGKGSSNVR